MNLTACVMWPTSECQTPLYLIVHKKGHFITFLLLLLYFIISLYQDENVEDIEEKARLISQVLELQNTLEDLSSKVDNVKEENLRLKSENQVKSLNTIILWFLHTFTFILPGAWSVHWEFDDSISSLSNHWRTQIQIINFLISLENHHFGCPGSPRCH